VFGARVGVTFGYAAGVLLMVPLFVMMILPFLNGSFDSANLTNKLGDSGLAWGGLQLALVWLWLMCWSAWGVDVCATFAPEYKDTVRDTKYALRSAALFSMVVYIVLPIGLIGGAGPKLVEAYDFPGAMDKIVGSTRLTDFFVVCLIFSFIITMNTATADGGRALYGISRDGMTIKQLGKLNRYSVPGTAMTVDMVFNILLCLFVGNIFGILAASNLGYVLAHMFALSGFVLLRKDRPNWPRPIKLHGIFTPIAGLLALWCLVLTVVGFGYFDTAGGGYGGTKEKVIGVAVLVAGLLLFFFRRLVQDKERIHWREDTPTMPDQVSSGVGAPVA
jgi:amino acid transporter